MVRNQSKHFWAVTLGSLLFAALFIAVAPAAQAQVVNHDVTVTATVYGPPPTTQAVILQPTDGAVFETTPLVVEGTCGPDLLVRVFNNGDLAGSITCASSGTFTMNITLEIGSNELTALNYDEQNQAGPDSPAVTVMVNPPPVDPDDPVVGPTEPPEDEVITDPDVVTPIGETENIPAEEAQTPLFQDTYLEPIAKLLGTELLVSNVIKVLFDAISTTIFTSTLLALFLWALFLVWNRFL